VFRITVAPSLRMRFEFTVVAWNIRAVPIWYCTVVLILRMRATREHYKLSLNFLMISYIQCYIQCARYAGLVSYQNIKSTNEGQDRSEDQSSKVIKIFLGL